MKMKNKNLINLINMQKNKAYSTNSNLELKLLPWQITGLTDGEGGFYYSILKPDSGITGFKVNLEFKIVQKSHSVNVLENIKNYFSCGNVVIDNRKTDTKKYHVTNINDIIYSLGTDKSFELSDDILVALKNRKEEMRELIHLNSNLLFIFILLSINSIFFLI